MLLSISSLRPTLKERILIRDTILDGMQTAVTVWDNYDGTWAAETAGIVFEAPTAAELFHELAAVLEEV